MTKKKAFIRIMAIILAALMAGSVLVSVIASTRARAVTQSEIDDLQSQQKEIQQKQQDLKSQINSLQYSQSSAIAKKEVLDEQVQLTQDEIDNLDGQIKEYDTLIAEKTVEVQDAQQAEEKQWDVYKVRMRVMEENGTISYWAIIFGASSFSDMLARIDMVSDIMQSDESSYQNLVAARKATEDAKTALENTQQQQKTKQTELTASEATLQSQVEEASALVEQIEGNLETYNELYDQTTAEEDKVKAAIEEKEAKLKKQQEAEAAAKAAAEAAAKAAGQKTSGGGSSGSGTGSAVGTGSFIWPSYVSRRVTSPFGTRYHPVYHVYKYHSGVDIGGVGYGSDVHAADGGTVITAEYSSGYGNYVVISHGNGYSTLYGHMSKLLVSAGETVSQGDVIGLTGSTGVSTGPHIHFEIWLNGSRVNPLDYFTDYIAAWDE